MPDPRELLFIEWVDSHSTRGWAPAHELHDQARLLTVHTVGYLIHEDEDVVAVAGSVYDPSVDFAVECACGDITIPRCAIKSMRTLSGRGKAREVNDA